MYVGRDFDPAHPDESEVYTLDFVRDVNVGENLSSATWTCSVAEDSVGADASAASRLSGGASVTGTKTSQRVAGLQAGVKYILAATVVTNQSNTKVLHAHVTCEDPD